MNKARFIRIFISYIVVVFLVSVFILIFLKPLIRTQYLDDRIEKLTHLSIALQIMIKPLLEQENRQDLDLLIKDIYEQTDIRISLIHSDGSVIAESLKDFQEMESHRNRPEFRAALLGEDSHIVRYSTTAMEEMLYFASPVFIQGNISAVLRLSIFLDDLQYILDRLQQIILLVAIMVILVSLFFSYYIAKRLTMPVSALVQGFKRLGEGDLETRILYHREEPEIKELAERFNEMTENIKQIVRDLSLQTEELEGIISTIQTGIALLNEKGKIILSNDHFKKIFSTYKITDKFFWEVIRDGQLNEQVSRLIEKKKNFTAEIELSEKIYLCNGMHIDKKGKSILVFHDITRSRELAQIKKDLITNISHELRTPLTSIKGYIETMDSAGEKDRERYLKIIKRNTERLINIVNDLLSLSELEGKSGNLQIEKMDLKEIITNIYKMFEPARREKHLKFNLNIQQDLPQIESDIYKMEQILINLIDNAIKYTEKGEVTVSIESLQGNKIKIEVADTGIGIRKEELKRIFERFYVVNKARSRQQGGTGLGLSIVKHIVILHGGEIKVDSHLGTGTRLTVILPVRQP